MRNFKRIHHYFTIVPSEKNAGFLFHLRASMLKYIRALHSGADVVILGISREQVNRVNGEEKSTRPQLGHSRRDIAGEHVTKQLEWKSEPFARVTRSCQDFSDMSTTSSSHPNWLSCVFLTVTGSSAFIHVLYRCQFDDVRVVMCETLLNSLWYHLWFPTKCQRSMIDWRGQRVDIMSMKVYAWNFVIVLVYVKNEWMSCECHLGRHGSLRRYGLARASIVIKNVPQWKSKILSSIENWWEFYWGESAEKVYAQLKFIDYWRRWEKL